MKTVLLGAGHIGHAIARLLHACGDYQLLVADCNARALDPIQALGIPVALVDFNDRDALRSLLSGRDVCLNALPWQMAITVANAARLAGTHYLDLTEDVHATRAIATLAAGADTAFMPQCGLAPGFVGIVAHHLTRNFDTIHEVKMRVGALPESPTNALKYNLTWSVDGLINEYCRLCEAIRDGRRLEVQPLEGLEHFSLDGVEYEAFNTSGGLGTLCNTLSGRVRNLDYKSVRYPGHRHLVTFLLEELRLREDPAQLKALLRKSVPATMQDVVLVFVTVSGMRQGVYMQEVFSRKIFAATHDGVHESAIQITTAAGMCTALDLLRTGKLPPHGFLPQEAIALPDFLANRFGRVYGAGVPQQATSLPRDSIQCGREET